MEEGNQKFTFFVALCFSLNYIIGTGFLTLPWAFQQTGILLGFICVAFVSIFSIFSVMYILEAMARAEILRKHKAGLPKGYSMIFNISQKFQEHQNDRIQHKPYQASTDLGDRNFFGVVYEDLDHSDSLKQDNNYNDNDEGIESDRILDSRRELNDEDKGDKEGIVSDTVKYESTELCDIFLGPKGRIAYTITITIYLYMTLWAYATVFAKMLAAHADIGPSSYAVYLALFAGVVVPCSLMELSEQITVQVILSCCRVLMFALMVGTILYAQTQFLPTFGEYLPPASAEPNLFHMDKIYLLLPVATYASIFHQALPDLSQPVADKSQLLKIFSSALVISMVAYSLVGVTVSWYFSDTTNVASNLNWLTFHGKYNEVSDAIPVYARLISFFIVLFPAFDVASVFPLNAITLGNSLMGSYFGAEVHLLEASALKTRREIFRLLAAMPPIIAAYLVRDLGAITDFAGLTGFAVAFIFPALLGYFSQKEMKEFGLTTKTQYSIPGISSQCCQVLTFALGIGLTIFVLTSIILCGAA